LIAKCVFNGCGWERALRYPIVSDEDIVVHSLAHLKGYPSHLVQIFAFDPAEADEITTGSPLPEDAATLRVCWEPGCEDPPAFVMLDSNDVRRAVCSAHCREHAGFRVVKIERMTVRA